MSEHKKTITSLAWNHTNNDLIVTTGADREIIIWNIPQQKVVSRISRLQASVVHIITFYDSQKSVVFIASKPEID